jgi:hypothetical protein
MENFLIKRSGLTHLQAASRRIFSAGFTSDWGHGDAAVELALRLDPTRYRLTLGCLQLRGPLLEGTGGMLGLGAKLRFRPPRRLEVIRQWFRIAQMLFWDRQIILLLLPRQLCRCTRIPVSLLS